MLYLVVLVETIFHTTVLFTPNLAEALLLVALVITTLLNLSRRLSGGKVLLGAAIAAVIGGGAHAISAATAIPFGPFTYTDAIGPTLFGSVAWAIPLLWIVIVFNARSVARMMLRPWRKTKTYGFWVIGIATLLVMLFDLALEPFAAKFARYWLWLPTKFASTWHGMPWINSFGWALTSLLIFAFATPFLINREPRTRKSQPEFPALAIWVGLLALFGIGAIWEGLWSAAILAIAVAIGSAVFAMRGARW